MKKQILSIGKTISKAEQKSIYGGAEHPGGGTSCHRGKFAVGCLCNYDSHCASGYCRKGWFAFIGMCQPA
ncbi:hypothetical protein [Tenacibaculum xiamenense]|uniref:hypothetical protein n=1 Tax=Tenacibaculum xiamenense TaxID=1261553 RepID=UPI0038B5A4F0